MIDKVSEGNWSYKTLSDLTGSDGIFCDGDWIESKDQDKNGTIRLIQLSDIGDGIFQDRSDRYLTRDKASLLNCTFLQEGDVLIARMPDPLGRCCIFPLKGENKFITAVDICIVRVDKEVVDNKFLCYSINSPQIRNAIHDLKSGTTRKRISRNNLNTINIPCPPLSEQRSIVARIEELFTKLNAGGQLLETTKEQLRTYKQAVLKSAFEGRLTKKNIVKDELPSAWRSVKLNDICKKIIGGGTPKSDHPDYWSGDIPWISSADIFGIRDIKPRRRITSEAINDSATNILPRGGIIVVTRVGLGKVAVAPYDICFSQDNQGLILNPELVTEEYAIRYLMFAVQTFKAKSRGTTISGITKNQLRNLKFILPPKEDQIILIKEIESRISDCENLEITIEDAIRRTEDLKRSILKQAFEGKLVKPQTN